MFTKNAGYEKVIADFKKDPSQSQRYLCEHHGVSYQYLFTYKRKRKTAGVDEAPRAQKVVVRSASGAMRAAEPEPEPTPAPKKVPNRPRMVTVEVPEDEVAEVIIHGRKNLVIPSSTVFQAMNDEQKARVDRIVVDALMKKNELSSVDRVSSKKKGHISNGG